MIYIDLPNFGLGVFPGATSYRALEGFPAPSHLPQLFLGQVIEFILFKGEQIARSQGWNGWNVSW